jgi:hypothetical protein
LKKESGMTLHLIVFFGCVLLSALLLLGWAILQKRNTHTRPFSSVVFVLVFAILELWILHSLRLELGVPDWSKWVAAVVVTASATYALKDQ